MCRASGSTAKETAEKLGFSKTRNAVIGKWNRLGLAVPASSNRPKNRPKRKKMEGVTLAGPRAGSGKKDKTRYIPIPHIPDCVRENSILSLTSTQCRYPIGDPRDADFGFCADKCDVLETYCEHHKQVCTQPLPDRQKKPDVFYRERY